MNRGVFKTVVLGLMAAWVAGCSSDDHGPALGLERFFDAAPYSNPACNGVDERLAGRREMRLFANGNGDVQPLTTGLARYYRRHSLSFFTLAEPLPIDTTYALDTDNASLGTALQAAFPGVDLNNDAALMSDPVLYAKILTFAANFITRPMIEFARAHGNVGTGVTNLVRLPQLVRPGGNGIAPPGSTLAGLAVSPSLLVELTRSMSPEGDIWKGVELPPGFTPMMFLDGKTFDAVISSSGELKDLIVAHEFGHTAALLHTMVERNLMFPSVRLGVNDCTDSLDDSQLTTMRTSLGLDGTTRQPLKAGEGRDQTLPPALTTRFTPADLRALLAGDGRAVRLLLAPLL